MRGALLGLALTALVCRSTHAQQRVLPDTTITATSIGGVRVCQPLDSVAALYPDAQDTMLFSGGGVRWPGKVVGLGKGTWLFVEASYVDRSRVWRISTTSPAFTTANGLRVGSTTGDVRATRERMVFTFPAGGLVVRLPGAGISFEVDDSSAARVARAGGAQGSPLAALGRSARLTRIMISASCRRGR